MKVSALFLSLAMVYLGMHYFNSADFKKSFQDLFGADAKAYHWCPDHAVDFTWLDDSVSPKWKAATAQQIQKRFCRLTLEPLQNIDLKQITFKPLLKVQSAEAKTSTLEWSPEANVYQVNGLPFFSTSLGREILDK